MKFYTTINIRLVQSDTVDDKLADIVKTHINTPEGIELLKKGIVDDIKDMWGESEGFDCKIDIIRHELKD